MPFFGILKVTDEKSRIRSRTRKSVVRIRTSDERIPIWESQKLTDPTDPEYGKHEIEVLTNEYGGLCPWIFVLLLDEA
jgi:hypothetical protein